VLADLLHEARVIAEGAQVPIPHVDVVYEHGPGLGVVEAQKQQHEGALSGAAGTADSDGSAGLDDKREVSENGAQRPGRVRESHVSEFDAPAHSRWPTAPRVHRINLRLPVDQLKQSCSGDASGSERAKEDPELADGRRANEHAC
jgi:hypothetical protein